MHSLFTAKLNLEMINRVASEGFTILYSAYRSLIIAKSNHEARNERDVSALFRKSQFWLAVASSDINIYSA